MIECASSITVKQLGGVCHLLIVEITREANKKQRNSQMIQQLASQKFSSPCGKAHMYVENDMPVGSFHDFVLQVKGQMVDLMVKAQKEEHEMAEAQKKSDCSEGE